jgi:hydroxymethylglutaryl-CoA reductase
MGANFINSCLERIAETFKNEQIQVVMSILSNYVPECLVRAEVSCPVEDFFDENPAYFAEKFVQAVRIAQVEPYRAVTHNKGIMNGIDAVVLATGNDFRAVAAGAHAYAAKSGQYRSLTDARIENGVFYFWIEIPLALGTVGGLTKLHPLAKLSLEILGQPSAKELMQIVAVAGLAQNFAALKALTTTGIQQGHMKMHLMNILNQLEANVSEKNVLLQQFQHKTVSYNEVAKALHAIRLAEVNK